MSSLFTILNIASRAMTMQQKNIQIIEQNVTNANTVGYHRQEAVFKNGMPYGDLRFKGTSGGGQMGTGVLIEEIKRYSLEFFDDRYRTTVSNSKYWETQQSLLKQLETTLAETSEDGLVAKLDSFWSGWQLLNGEPSNMALRSDLRDRAIALVQAFNNRSAQLEQMRKDQDLTIRARVDEINKIATQIAELNREIPRVKALRNQPNDLLDERDRLIDRLSEISGVQATTQANGELIVSLGGHVLVVGLKTNPLTIVEDPNNANLAKIIWQDDGLDFNPTNGELLSLFNVRDNIIVEQQQGLDTLAQTLHDRVNYVHEYGYSMHDPLGIPTPPPPPLPSDATAYAFFALAPPPGSIASRLRVDEHILDPDFGLANIAAAEGPGYAPGDGNNAREISDLQHGLFLNNNSTSMNAYYTYQVASLGLAVKRAQMNVRDYQNIATALKEQREEIGGVSLNEEAIKLMETQKAYNAAARIVTAADEMLDRVINGMGRVGI